MKFVSIKLKYIFFFLSMFILMSYSSRTILDRCMSSFNKKSKESNKFCDIKVLDALIEFENNDHDLAIEVEANPEDAIPRGTIVLTGEFGRINNQDVQEIVNSTLEEIDYDKIVQEIDQDRTVVTVINKQDASHISDNQSNNSIENDIFIKSVLDSQQFAKNIAEKMKLSDSENGESPLVIRNFLNKKNGVRSFVIDVSTPVKKQFLAEEKETFYRENKMVNRRLNGKSINMLTINKLSKVGPKVFLSSSDEIK